MRLNVSSYCTNEFELQSHGDFWISETPDVPGSKSWDSSCPRTVTWALLRHDTGRNKGAKILFLNTHLDHVSELARENGATLILDFIRRFKDVGGIIVTGDFNDEKQSIVRRFVEELGLADTLAAVNATGPTFHGFTGNGFTRIDYILASPDLKVIHGEVVTDKPHGLFVSDHFPIYADIVLENQTSQELEASLSEIPCLRSRVDSPSRDLRLLQRQQLVHKIIPYCIAEMTM